MNIPVGKSDPEWLPIARRVLERLQKRGDDGSSVCTVIEHAERHLKDALKRRRKLGAAECCFEILRQYSSWTPLLVSHDRNAVGGGYFFCAKDYGIVIDPGHGFLSNFCKTPHALSDINAIVVTHLHTDHLQDLESLANLFRIQNRAANKPNGHEPPSQVIRISREIHATLTGTNLSGESSLGIPYRKPLFLNTGALVKSMPWLFNEEIRNLFDLRILNPGDGPIQLTDDVVLATFRAEHDELIDNRYCLGLVFNCAGRVVVISGDTGWYPEVTEGIRRALKMVNAGDRVDLLVAHLGSIKASEFALLNGDLSLGSSRYKTHLGIIGVCALIEELNPKLCVVSEIGEELAPVLKDIGKVLNEELKTQVHLADVFDQIDLPLSSTGVPTIVARPQLKLPHA